MAACSAIWRREGRASDAAVVNSEPIGEPGTEHSVPQSAAEYAPAYVNAHANLLDLVSAGDLRVDDSDDDDPVLYFPDGTPVDTWREDYPYDARLERPEYEQHKRLLQIELLKLQNYVKESGERLVVLF